MGQWTRLVCHRRIMACDNEYCDCLKISRFAVSNYLIALISAFFVTCALHILARCGFAWLQPWNRLKVVISHLDLNLQIPKSIHSSSSHSRNILVHQSFPFLTILFPFSRWILNPNPSWCKLNETIGRTRRCGCENGRYTHGIRKADWWNLRRPRDGTGKREGVDW